MSDMEYVGWPYHEVNFEDEIVTEGDLSLVQKWHFVNIDKLQKPINGKFTNVIYLLPNKRPNQSSKKVEYYINIRGVKKLAKTKKFIGIEEINLDMMALGFDDTKYDVSSGRVVMYPRWATPIEKKWYDVWFTELHAEPGPLGDTNRAKCETIGKYVMITDKVAALDPNRMYVVRGEMIRQALNELINRPFAVENYHLFSYMKDYVIHGGVMANKSKLFTASYKDFYKDYAKDENNKDFLSSSDLRKMKLYHISPNPNMKEMTPRVPGSRLSYENTATKRVCFAPDIPNCISAIPAARHHGIMYVYVPVITDETTGFRPSRLQVADVGVTGEVWICTDVKLKKIGTINFDGTDKDKVTIKPLNESDIYLEGVYEAESGKLSAAERRALKDNQFGLPKERKYPLNDDSHVRQAIKFFNYCPKESRDELAKNIIKACKSFDIDLSEMNISNKNSFSKYLGKLSTVKKASESFTLL